MPDNYTDKKLKDFFHGERLFGANQNRLSPKYSFLYHVFFEINSSTEQTIYRPIGDPIREVGMLAKSVDLPKFDVELKNLNAYNQNVNIQTGIKYNPVKIDFHDDSANIVRNFWEDYMTFYYSDSYNEGATAKTMSENRYSVPKSTAWGYLPRDNRNYLTAVKIYSLSMGKYSLYTLVNPIIDTWTHGTHSAGQNEFIGHSISLQYEYVRYADGYVRDLQSGTSNVDGFGGIHYDLVPSELTKNWASSKGKVRSDGVPYPDRDPRIDIFRQAEAFGADPYKTYGAKPRVPQQSTLASRLRASILRAGQSVVNSSILKAENRLRNVKIGNSTVNKILQPALQNTISQGASGLSNSIFPSPLK